PESNVYAARHFFFQAEDGIRDFHVTGVQTCALPISKQRTTRELYADALTQAGVLNAEEVQARIDEYRAALDNGQHVVKSLVKEPNTELFVDWTPYLGHKWTARHDTRIPLDKLREIAAGLTRIPEGFVVQRQVAKVYEDRNKMTAGAMPINWGYAETLAY